MAGIGLDVFAEVDRRLRRCLRDARDACLLQPVEDRRVLRDGDAVGGVVQGGQVGVDGAPVVVGQRVAGEGEVGAELNCREDDPLQGRDAVSTFRGERLYLAGGGL